MGRGPSLFYLPWRCSLHNYYGRNIGGLLIKYKKTSYDYEDISDFVTLFREWARSVLCKMRFSKKRAISTSKILSQDLALIEIQFLIDV